MSGHDAACLDCGKETYHRSGKCMRCRNVGNFKPDRPASDSSGPSYIGRGRRSFDVDNHPPMSLLEAIKRLEDTIQAHKSNKRNKFAIADRRAIEVLLKEIKNDSSVSNAKQPV